MSEVTSYRSTKEPAKSDDETSSSDGHISSSDTDDEVFQASKRLKIEGKKKCFAVDASTTAVAATSSKDETKMEECISRKKPKVNNLWSKVLQDQNSDEVIKTLVNGAALTSAHTRERGPETFSRPRFCNKVSENDDKFPAPMDKTIENKIENFTFDKNHDSQQQSNGNDNNQAKSPTNRRFREKKKPYKKHGNKQRQKLEKFKGKANNVPIFPYGVPVILKKRRELTAQLSIEDASEEIAFRLWEQKRHLIRKLVTFVGIEKAILFCNKVEVLEENGGMQTLKGNRRRTPGGVFIRVMQLADEVDQDKLKEILDEENTWQNRGNRKRKFQAQNKKSPTEPESVGSEMEIKTPSEPFAPSSPPPPPPPSDANEHMEIATS